MFGRAPSGDVSGRGAPPRSLWALTGLPPATARELEDWLDSLGDLPLDAWVRVADRCGAIDYASLPASRACQRIERLIDEHGLEFTAWLVRDFVETATFHLRQSANDRPRILRARLSLARMAAEWSALAKMCRPWLAPAEHDLLCAAFGERPGRRDSAAS